VGACLAWRLFRARQGQAARSFWAFALAAISLAAIFGGTYHGFLRTLSERQLSLLWQVTVFAAGAANFGMVAGSATAETSGGLRRTLLAAAALKLALYTGWMFFHDAFIWVVVDTGVALAALAALHGAPAIRDRDSASRWILGGAGLSLLAAAVQTSGLALARGFSHNDLYHVMQIGANGLFYAGATRLRDRGAAAGSVSATSF
jgi:hypothetical protein